MIHRRFALFILAFISIASFAAMQPNYYKQWMGLPSNVLLEKGHQYSEIQVKPDSALVCFSIVANRYNKQMSDKEKQQCCVAFIGKWYTFFFLYFDHAKSMEALTRAQEINEESKGKEQARIDLNFGCMYQTLAEQGEDTKQYELALQYFNKSFQQALKNKQMGIANMAFSNLLTISYELGKINTMASTFKQYVEANKENNKDKRIDYDIQLYKGLLLLQQEKYAEAIQTFKAQKLILPNEYTYLRYHVVANDNLAKAYAASGNLKAAIQTLQENLEIAHKVDMKDLKLEVYKYLSQYYGALGDKEQESKWRTEYLSIKDTLLNYQQVASVNEVRFLAEMKKVDEQISHEAQKRRAITYTLFLALGLMLLIAIFLFIVYKKNKLLAKRNRKLYNNNVEMLRKEEEERQRRQLMEQTIAKLREENQQHKSDSPFMETKKAESPTEKYKNSNLNDEQKQQLLNDIREVMESNQKIFDLDFTQDQLADLVQSKSKYVSQVINELCKCNFSAFINEYRVKEACQRINDIKHYGNLTIEAVSMSVGFKSRSTFNSAFRKFTGLTPGEYLRIAREKQ